MYSSLTGISTPIIQVEVSKENGVKFAGGSIYMDADDSNYIGIRAHFYSPNKYFFGKY